MERTRHLVKNRRTLDTSRAEQGSRNRVSETSSVCYIQNHEMIPEQSKKKLGGQPDFVD